MVWGIGPRAGDPMGLSFKYYLSDDVEYELNLGYTGLFAVHYLTPFGKLEKFETCFDKDECRSDSLRIAHSYSAQFNYLFYQFFPGVDAGNLLWYYGFGGQFRYVNVDYVYEEKIYKENNKVEWKDNQVYRLYTYDLGFDAIMGLEYVFEKVPITMFFDLNIFYELLDDSGIFRPQAGFGFRYNHLK